MADGRIRVHLVAIVAEVVEIELGVWCDVCMLPAAARITLATSVGDGPTSLSTIVRCYDCV